MHTNSSQISDRGVRPSMVLVEGSKEFGSARRTGTAAQRTERVREANRATPPALASVLEDAATPLTPRVTADAFITVPEEKEEEEEEEALTPEEARFEQHVDILRDV